MTNYTTFTLTQDALTFFDEYIKLSVGWDNANVRDLGDFVIQLAAGNGFIRGLCAIPQVLVAEVPVIGHSDYQSMRELVRNSTGLAHAHLAGIGLPSQLRFRQNAVGQALVREIQLARQYGIID